MKTTFISASCAAFLALGVLLSGFSATARADEDGGLLSNVGADAEIYVPFSGKTKDTFGSSFKGFGIGFGSVRPKAGGRFSPDFTLLRESENGDRALLAIAGLQYRKTFDPDFEENERYVP